MKHWRARSLLVAGLLMAAVAVACGGGDSGGELSVEQYFEQVGAIVEGLQDRTVTFEQPLEQEFDSEAEQIGAFRDAFSTAIPIFRAFVDDLGDIDAPPEVADAHGDLIAGIAGLVDGLEDLTDGLEGVKTLSEMQDLVISGFGSAIGQLAAACLQLQTIADENAIDVDLGCAA